MNEIEFLFSAILNCSRADLYLNRDLRLDSGKISLIASALKRRLTAEPLQYILGKTEFMGLEFKVNKNVFIPRPETELLVETVIKLASKYQSIKVSEYQSIRVSKYQSIRVSKLNIMDLGTGSGCIAVSLAKFLPNAEITAVDISDKALMLARRNAQLNKARVNFLKIDLRGNWEFRANTYDIIASNPPYIPSAEINRLQPEISYEPRIALDGGRDGLDFCRGIIKQAPRYLKDAGLLIMEIGFGQRQAIENILDRSKGLCVKEIIKDYNGIDRVLLAQKR